MCLHGITKEYKPLLRKERRVWKVLKYNLDNVDSKDVPNPMFQVMSHRDKYNVPMDRMIKAQANKETVWTQPNKWYTTGFHCFLTKKDAKKFLKYSGSPYAVVVPVTVTEVRYRGKQSYTSRGWKRDLVPCVVTNKMMLSRKDWEKALRKAKVKF